MIKAHQVDLTLGTCSASTELTPCSDAYTEGKIWISIGEGVGSWLKVNFPMEIPVIKFQLDNRPARG